MQNGSATDGVAALEAQMQNLLDSLLELGICKPDRSRLRRPNLS